MSSLFGQNLPELIKTIGYIGVFFIVFAESGLFIGFFLPGDSLLFTAGFLASQGYLNFFILAPLCILAAVLGDSVGYAFGKKIGPRLFNKEDSLFFKKENLEYAQNFYNEYGGKTIIIARFMPIVRTFAPILAGVGSMDYSKFISYNIVGGVLWSLGLSGLGYLLGSVIPDIDKYLLPIIVLIILLSVLPGVIHFLRARRSKEI